MNKKISWLALFGVLLMLLGAGGIAPPSPGTPGVNNRGHVPPVRAVATSNCTLATCTVTTDGVTLVAGDRELRTGQTSSSENGVYVVGTVTAGSAPRTAAPEFAATADKVAGTCLRATEGTAYRGQWCLVGSGPNWAMPDHSVNAADFGVSVGSADNTAALQAAINAAGTRGRVELSAGTFNFASATLASTPILITGSQRIVGTGWDTPGGSILTVTGSTAVPDMIKIAPTAATRGTTLQDFYISACPTCKHAIKFDGSVAASFAPMIDHIRIDQVGFASGPLIAPSTEDLAAWTKTRAAGTTATQIVTSAGTTTTYFLTSPAWSGATGGTPIAITFRVKAGTLNTLELYDNGAAIGKVKADGTILTTPSGGSMTSLGVQGDGSWRFRMVYTGNASLVLFACSPSTFSDTWTSAGGDTLGVVIENVTQNQGVAIYAEGVGGANGTPVLATIKNSWFLGGGIEMLAGGDTNTISENLFGGLGRALDISSQGGASTLVVFHNNIQSAGGVRFGNYIFGVQFIWNEVEYVTPGFFAGSRGAIVDLDGPFLQSPVVEHNSFQVAGGGGGVTAKSIRVNDAIDTSIVSNIFQRGTTPPSNDVRVEALAVNTKIGTNDFMSGPPWTYVLSDSGTHTSLTTQYQDLLLIGNGQAFASVDEAGTARRLLSIDGAGTMLLGGYHGAATVASTATGTYLYDENHVGQGVVNSVLSTWGALATTAQLGTVKGVKVTSGKVTLGGDSAVATDERLRGRATEESLLAGVCRLTGTADRFAMAADHLISCTAKCATVTYDDGGTVATCVKGWTLFTTEDNYEYGTECGTAETDPSMTYKVCCCTGTGRAQPLWRD